MSVYYNENDPFAAEWLRQLMWADQIPAGVVDERSIEDVTPDDLRGFVQCHFFAGIGVWPAALRLAGWPDDRPAWTGSCPCQPFSEAGPRAGFADERHLWPSWHWLIHQHRPECVLGEQVASPDGRVWLDLVSTDLEADGYAVAAADLPAAGVEAPHRRQRLWFCGVELAARQQVGFSRRAWLAGSAKADDDSSRLWGWPGLQATAGEAGRLPAEGDRRWHNPDWVQCRDGRRRPVEPGTFPLAHGSADRLGRLRGYGNALVLPLAATFVAAVLDVL